MISRKLIPILLAILIGTFSLASAQYKPDLQIAKIVNVDSRLISISGYLIVPENRKHPSGNQVKIPFVFVRRPDQNATKNISLYTTGGPGFSTTLNIDSISYNSGFLKYGVFIAFDQRRTKRSIPRLTCEEVDEAIRRSYRQHESRDSLVRLATMKCRKKLIVQHIDLSSYTTLESAEDINDLRLALHIDSLNLVGISYSGGLMLTVAKSHPEAVCKLILNSPLPSFVNYEERGLTKINEALDQVFANCITDSVGSYHDLKNRFQTYFSSLPKESSVFKFQYLEKGKLDSITIQYSRSELLDVVVNHLNTNQVKNIPKVITEILSGRHQPYIKELMDGYFVGNP